MADVYLSQDEIKVLDQTRQRLFQLTNSIASLKQDVLRTNPLPEWSSLQASTSILSANTQSLMAHLSKHSDLMSRTVAYPSTNFPGRQQENVLNSLLRKKVEPQVESWVEDGRTFAASEAGRHDDELWTWANGWINERLVQYAEEAGDNYTPEEREIGIANVRTGLRRKLDDDESSEDEDEDEDEEMTNTNNKSAQSSAYAGAARTDGKTKSIEDILRLATAGVVVNEQIGGAGARR